MPFGPIRILVMGDIGRGKTTVATIIEDALIRAGLDPDRVRVQAIDPRTNQPFTIPDSGERSREARQAITRRIQQHGDTLRQMDVEIHTVTMQKAPFVLTGTKTGRIPVRDRD